MALATGPQQQAAERRPGDFQRHPNTGAPYVNHPTETTKAGKPKRAMYGRPSSLGKQIENTTNLQKWAERAVALGALLDFTGDPDGPGLYDELDQLARDHWTLDDADARPILDAVAVKAKNLAQAGLSAERGTHTHALTEDSDNEADWIERARSGEDLGIPHDAQAALVQAWETMLDAEGIEILAVETAVVDDQWRQAGTLDRIARLTRDRTFLVAGGELVTLPAGWVGVLDVKTGKLRADRTGHPDYWHGYAVQIASYAQSVPYDTETDTRGEWEWPIDQRYGIIAHLDVAAAIEGTARCRLVLVDLEAGRRAGQLCVAARDWEKRRDVFSLVNDDTPIYEIAVTNPAGDDEAASPTQPAAVESGSVAPSTPAAADEGAEHPPAPAPSSASPEDERAELRKRAADMERNAIEGGWHPRFRAEWVAAGITADSTNDEIRAALDAIEPPFDPDPAPPHGIERPEVEPEVRHDRGATVDEETVDKLIDVIKSSDHRAVVNGWLRQAADAGESWSPRVSACERYVEITRAALSLARATDGDDEVARTILGHVLPGAEQPAFQVGNTLAALSIDDAKRVAALAEAFGESLNLQIAEDGTPRLDGPVAAVLAAA